MYSRKAYLTLKDEEGKRRHIVGCDKTKSPMFDVIVQDLYLAAIKGIATTKEDLVAKRDLLVKEVSKKDTNDAPKAVAAKAAPRLLACASMHGPGVAPRL